MQVAYNAVAGDLENRGLRIFVYGNDDVGRLHSDEVLYGSGDTTRDVEFWTDGFASLPYLM